MTHNLIYGAYMSTNLVEYIFLSSFLPQRIDKSIMYQGWTWYLFTWIDGWYALISLGLMWVGTWTHSKITLSIHRSHGRKTKRRVERAAYRATWQWCWGSDGGPWWSFIGVHMHLYASFSRFTYSQTHIFWRISMVYVLAWHASIDFKHQLGR